MDERAQELVDSFINGNRNDVCRTVLADTHAPQLAALVTRKLCSKDKFDIQGFTDADVFIRLLDHNS